jgi:hypothetical protein
MIVHDCVQGSREWWALRLGIPTASRFSRIVTAKQLKYSAGARPFAAELIGEQILGQPLDDKEVESLFMSRGNEMEDEARRWYEFHTGNKITQVGFVTVDGGGIGCSPDGLVGEPDAFEGGVEIKCRSAKKHMEIICGLTDITDGLQVQGSIWVTGLPWWDELAYHPKLPKMLVRTRPIPRVQEVLSASLDQFLQEMEKAKQSLEALGGIIEVDTANEAAERVMEAKS